MLIHAPDILMPDELQQLCRLLDNANWVDGRITAGTQSAQVKRNQQLPETAPELTQARLLVLSALERSPLFFSVCLPREVFPPLFNRYAGGMDFGAHVDNAIRGLPGGGRKLRTDVSATLFLSDPKSYDGGELVVEDTYGEQRIKLPAGHMIIYPSTSVHRVEPVTRGARLASFMWIQSMVREDAKRALLFDMDMAIATLRAQLGEAPPVVSLTSNYHNLLRMWAEV